MAASLSGFRAEPGQVRYHDLTFDPDFLFAVRENGEHLRFSRLDRVVLTTLAASPGRLFTRDQLLDAMGPDPDGSSDRNVDFVINRLRRKLKDSARTPRFIGTRYGEGYLWVASTPAAARSGFIVLGPVHGAVPPSRRPEIEARLDRLRQRLAEHYEGVHEVVFLPERSNDPLARGAFRYAVGVDVLAEADSLQLALTLREDIDRRLVRVIRPDVETGDDLEEVAETLVSAIWRDLALSPGLGETPESATLEIRMQDAALALSSKRGPGWRYIEKRLAQELKSSPDDPMLAIMSATSLFAHMLQSIDFDPVDWPARRAREAEIEALVLGALPAIREDPLLALGAAKLLLCVHRGHAGLVGHLLESARAKGANFAAFLSVAGQFHAFKGDLTAAIADFDGALALCKPESEFEVQLQVLKSQCLMARGDYETAQRLFERVAWLKPADRGYLQLFYLSPRDDADRAPILRHLDHKGAARAFGYLLFLLGRAFPVADQARTAIAGPARHLLRRFGRSIIPEGLPEPLATLASSLEA